MGLREGPRMSAGEGVRPGGVSHPGDNSGELGYGPCSGSSLVQAAGLPVTHPVQGGVPSGTPVAKELTTNGDLIGKVSWRTTLNLGANRHLLSTPLGINRGLLSPLVLEQRWKGEYPAPRGGWASAPHLLHLFVVNQGRCQCPLRRPQGQEWPSVL